MLRNTIKCDLSVINYWSFVQCAMFTHTRGTRELHFWLLVSDRICNCQSCRSSCPHSYFVFQSLTRPENWKLLLFSVSFKHSDLISDQPMGQMLGWRWVKRWAEAATGHDNSIGLISGLAQWAMLMCVGLPCSRSNTSIKSANLTRIFSLEQKALDGADKSFTNVHCNVKVALNRPPNTWSCTA